MSSGALQPAPVRRVRRTVEVMAFVFLWMATGLALHLSAVPYLLVGVPLTLVFQWGIGKKAVAALWLRDKPRFGLSKRGWVLACLVAAFPCYSLLTDIRAGTTGSDLAMGIVAVLGAIPAAYCACNFRRQTFWPLVCCLVIAGGMGVLVLMVSGIHFGFSHDTLSHRLLTGARGFLMNFPLVFVVEEVSFRGALDTHIHPPGETGGSWTAILVSSLWGLWHVPLAIGSAPLASLILPHVIAHCLIGIPLSIYWRRSGNLVVPGAAHAIVDALRNMLQ
jgi:hypothetical protein